MSGRKDTYRPAEGVKDVDRERARERERQERERAQEREEENDKPKSTVDPVAEYKRLTEMRSGGRYVPPAKLRALQEAMVASQSPKDFQRVEWEKLKKSINRYINQVNVSNIREVVRNVFSQNLIRGRGIFVRSIMKAQAASLTYTNVYATLAAIVNSKLPQVGELLVTRLVVQFRRAYRRNNKAACISSSMFLAHLCNHQVAHEVVCLQMLHLLLEKPTNDSVEIAVGFMRQIGAYLSEFSPAAATGVFERFRTILHEGNVETRIQYMIEVLFQVRKEGYKDHPVIAPGLDLVEEDDQITHMIGLDDTGLKTEDGLNVFQFDKDYEENEQKYNRVKEEILGDEDEEDEEDESSSEEEQEEEKAVEAETGEKVVIKDMTNTELINLRKSIYLTIMSSMSMQEITHKLVRIEVPKGNEIEVVNMVVECCAQEKTYNKIFGGVSTQLCRLNRKWHDLFKGAFKDYYGKIHRYKTLQIRNIATLFGYLLASDGLSWEVFEAVYISEEHTTSSSRVFIKFLFEEMQQELGVKQLKERFAEDYIQPYISTLFPKTTREETMFAINFFTVLHLGPLTDGMRDYLETLPPPKRDRSSSRSSYNSRSRSRSRGRSRSRSYSTTSSRSYSSRSRSRSYSSRSRSRSYSSRSRSYSSRSRSRSRSYSRRRGRSYSRTPSNRSYSRSRSRSYSRSPSRSRSRSRRSYSRTPPRRDRRSRSRNSYSKTPPRRGSRSPSGRSPRSDYSSRSRSPRRRSRSNRGRSVSHSPPRAKQRSPSSRRDYTPPPQRPRNWEEARKRNRSNSPNHPSTQSKRPKAADYL